MNINKINTLPHQNQANINFSGKTYSDLTQVEDLPCAICGKKMYTKKELEYILDSFTPSISSVLKDKSFERYKNTNAYALLEELAKKHPKTPIKNAIKDQDFQITFQFAPEYTQHILTEIVAKASKTRILAPAAIKKLEKLKPYYAKEEVEIINTMAKYAEKYPDKTFSEIFSMPEVFNFHLENIRNYKNSRLPKVNKIMKDISNLAKQLPTDEQDEVKIIEDDVVRPLIDRIFFNPYMRNKNNEILTDIYTGQQLYRENYAYRTETKKINILNQYADLWEHSSRPDIMKKIYKLAEQLPFDTSLVDFFILDSVKKDKTDRDIIWSLLNEVSTSYDHIIPRSKDGSNDLSNGLRVHKYCNEERDVIPYSIFCNYKVDLNENIQKQISKISSLITHEKLLNSDDYPVSLKENMLEASNGKIKIDTDEFVKDYKRMISKKDSQIKESKERLFRIVEHYRKINNSISQKIEELSKEIEELRENKTKNRKLISNAQKCLEVLMYEEVKNDRKSENISG